MTSSRASSRRAWTRCSCGTGRPAGTVSSCSEASTSSRPTRSWTCRSFRWGSGTCSGSWTRSMACSTTRGTRRRCPCGTRPSRPTSSATRRSPTTTSGGWRTSSPTCRCRRTRTWTGGAPTTCRGTRGRPTATAMTTPWARRAMPISSAATSGRPPRRTTTRCTIRPRASTWGRMARSSCRPTTRSTPIPMSWWSRSSA